MRTFHLTAAATVIVAAVVLSRSLSRRAPARANEPHLANIRQLTLRRRERRGVFQPRRQAADLPVDAQRPHLRPAVRHERRRLEREARVDRRRQDDLRLLLRRRPEDLLRLDARGRHGLPAEARSVQGLRLGARSVRHLHRESRRLGPQATDELRRLHRRGHALARRQDDRVHVAQGRRPRHLHDERRRHEHEAADAPRRATTAARSSRTTARRSSIAPGTRPTPRSRTIRTC